MKVEELFGVIVGWISLFGIFFFAAQAFSIFFFSLEFAHLDLSLGSFDSEQMTFQRLQAIHQTVIGIFALLAAFFFLHVYKYLKK